MATFIESPRVQVVLFLVCSLLIGCTDKEGIVEAEPSKPTLEACTLARSRPSVEFVLEDGYRVLTAR